MRQTGIPQAMTVGEVAAKLGVSHWTVRTWARNGRIPSFRIGRRVLIKVADIEAAINEAYRPARRRPGNGGGAE
jgi:excisionase family DNA binding protein